MADLVGLAIAHEIGHACGLTHATSGVMKAPLGPDDYRALATSHLAFTSAQALTLRQSATTLLSTARPPAAKAR